MKNIWQIITLLLALALVILTIKITFMQDHSTTHQNTQQSIDKKQIVLDAIMTRSSVRSYTTQKVAEQDIETLLRAGMAAPTAGNKQPWEFVVVTERETLDAFAKIVKGAHMAARAQVAIVVCGLPQESFPGPQAEYWVQDCSAATENILIAANAIELGAVWCGVYPNTPEDRVGQIAKLMNLPQNVIPLNIIVIGHPDTKPNVKDKWKTEKIHHNKYKGSSKNSQ